MASSTDVSAWKVKELREWLDANDVPYLKSAKKGELVALVESARAASAKSSAAARVEPSKMTVVKVGTHARPFADPSHPLDRQPDRVADGARCVVAGDAAEEGLLRRPRREARVGARHFICGCGGGDQPDAHCSQARRAVNGTPLRPACFATTRNKDGPRRRLRPSFADLATQSVVKEKAKSASPTRRRSIRRKLLDMPSDDEDEASSSVSRPKTVSPGHRRQAPSADAQTAGKARAVFIGALLLAVCAGYISFILIMKYRSG